MEWYELIVAIVRDLGLPVGLVVFGCWFLVAKMWPDWVGTRDNYTKALQAFTDVMMQVVQRLPRI